jgi:hypothetical protein
MGLGYTGNIEHLRPTAVEKKNPVDHSSPIAKAVIIQGLDFFFLD